MQVLLSCIFTAFSGNINVSATFKYPACQHHLCLPAHSEPTSYVLLHKPGSDFCFFLKLVAADVAPNIYLSILSETMRYTHMDSVFNRNCFMEHKGFLISSPVSQNIPNTVAQLRLWGTLACLPWDYDIQPIHHSLSSPNQAQMGWQNQI